MFPPAKTDAFVDRPQRTKQDPYSVRGGRRETGGRDEER